MKVFANTLFGILILLISQSVSGQQKNDHNGHRLFLTNWELKSTLLERSDGRNISTGRYSTGQWIPATVPTTVLNALVKRGIYPDPRVAMNNYLIPDISDEFNAEHGLNKYSYLPNHENPWKEPYWFRTEFKLPKDEQGKQVWLNFEGINYRAEVWLNGVLIADSSQMVGMFRRFRFNVTDAVNSQGENYLAVKIYPVDHYGKPGTQLKVFGPNRGPDEELFKDVTLKISGGWDCALPARDRNMGIYQPVYLSFTGPVDIVDPYVTTVLPLPDTSSAELSITVTLLNVSSDTVSGVLKGEINLLKELDMGGYMKKFSGTMPVVRFEKKVTVPGRGSVRINLGCKDFPQLVIKNPHLWWPIGYGEQYLHDLRLIFENDNKVSAVKNVTFGIREVTSSLHELNGDYGRVFYVNGQKIFCKGGWIQPDMLLDNSKKNLYDQIRLIANANLNLISSEDMPSPSDDLMDACDKYGIMWWEVFYQCWTTVPGTKSAYLPYDHLLAIQNERDIILRYRNHPALTAWCAENENVPGPDLYLALKSDLAELDTTRPFLASTAVWWDWKKLTPYIEPDLPVGTTDNGPPDYTWYPLPYYFNVVNDVKDQMFHNELGMDAIPTLSSLKKFIPN
ncbi:MAG: glycoside hydrolase family 2 protein, partial [Candidatus Kryptoniota bacterium]